MLFTFEDALDDAHEVWLGESPPCLNKFNIAAREDECQFQTSLIQVKVLTSTGLELSQVQQIRKEDLITVGLLSS